VRIAIPISITILDALRNKLDDCFLPSRNTFSQTKLRDSNPQHGQSNQSDPLIRTSKSCSLIINTNKEEMTDCSDSQKRERRSKKLNDRSVKNPKEQENPIQMSDENIRSTPWSFDQNIPLEKIHDFPRSRRLLCGQNVSHELASDASDSFTKRLSKEVRSFLRYRLSCFRTSSTWS
jgi:hypothetical protein